MTVSIKKSWWMTSLLGLILAAIGICMIAYSSSAWKLLIVIVGLGFVLNAFFDINAIKLSPQIFKKWAISNTVLNVLLGVLMIILPWLVSTIISWVIGAVLIIYGIGMIVELCVFRPDYLFTRMIIVSLLSIACGVLFIFDPSSFSKTVMIVVGVPCIVIGIILFIGSVMYRVKKGKASNDISADENTTTYEQTATVITDEENNSSSTDDNA